jgi:hypothetical protein
MKVNHHNNLNSNSKLMDQNLYKIFLERLYSDLDFGSKFNK